MTTVPIIKSLLRTYTSYTHIYEAEFLRQQEPMTNPRSPKLGSNTCKLSQNGTKPLVPEKPNA